MVSSFCYHFPSSNYLNNHYHRLYCVIWPAPWPCSHCHFLLLRSKLYEDPALFGWGVARRLIWLPSVRHGGRSSQHQEMWSARFSRAAQSHTLCTCLNLPQLPPLQENHPQPPIRSTPNETTATTPTIPPPVCQQHHDAAKTHFLACQHPSIDQETHFLMVNSQQFSAATIQIG